MKKLTIFIVALAVVCFFGATAYADLSDGLMAYYPCNGNVNDESVNSYDGTVHGVPGEVSFTSDRFGTPNSAGLVMGNEGPSGPNWIELPDMIDGYNSLSISIWVNEDHIGCVGGNVYIWFGRAPGSQGDFKGVWIAHWKLPTPPYLSFVVSTPGDLIEVTTPFSADWPGAWQHYVLVYDGVAGTLSAYHNTSLLGVDSTTPSQVATTDSYAGLATHWGTGGGRYHRFNGVFDDVRIYNRPLTAEEIQQLFNE